MLLVLVTVVPGDGVVAGEVDEVDDEDGDEEEVDAGEGLEMLLPLPRLGVLIFSARRLAARFSLRRTRSNSSLYPGHCRLAFAHWLHVGLVSSH